MMIELISASFIASALGRQEWHLIYQKSNLSGNTPKVHAEQGKRDRSSQTPQKPPNIRCMRPFGYPIIRPI